MLEQEGLECTPVVGWGACWGSLSKPFRALGSLQSSASVYSLSTAALTPFRGRARSELALFPPSACTPSPINGTFTLAESRARGRGTGGCAQCRPGCWDGPSRPVRVSGSSQSADSECSLAMAIIALFRGRARSELALFPPV